MLILLIKALNSSISMKPLGRASAILPLGQLGQRKLQVPEISISYNINSLSFVG
jgi:hypothetical protein